MKVYYAIAQAENGDILEDAFETSAEAAAAVADLMEEDEANGIYDPQAYQVVRYFVREKDDVVDINSMIDNFIKTRLADDLEEKLKEVER